eukprot:3088624-Amphidinium_carterae.2
MNLNSCALRPKSRATGPAKARVFVSIPPVGKSCASGFPMPLFQHGHLIELDCLVADQKSLGKLVFRDTAAHP